jgi:glycosyltransferase involved in cell wall biosynthesis
MTRKIRVLEGIRQGKIGGGESYLLGLVENMDRSVYEPVVLAFTDGPMIERLKRQGIEAHVIHTEKPFDIRIWKKVRNFIRAQRIDIVHAHGTRANSNLFWAAGSLKLPTIYTCHAWSFHANQNPLVRRFRIWSEEFLTRRMDINICGCIANRDTGRQLLKGFDAEVIYNSIDPERFNPFGVYRDLRPELGLKKDDLVIASVARFTLQKQPLVLIAAFAEVAGKVPNAKLLMVGDGEQKEKAKELIRELGLGGRVILQPFRQDIPEVLAAVDIFVLPSLWEAFPIALLEAMSMGKAVIGTAIDGTPEIISHRDNGLLVNAGRLREELAAALGELGENAALRERLREQAIKSIYNRYNVETLARRNEEIYRRLVTDQGAISN